MGSDVKADAQLLIKQGVSKNELALLRLFANADLDVVLGLLQNCPLQTLQKDEMLLVPGSLNQTLYLVLRGRLRVHLDSLETEPVQLIEAGGAAGEISLIDEKPTSAFVVADSVTRVLVLEQEVFWTLINTSHTVARNMLLMVVERMRSNNSLVADSMRTREQYRRQVNVDQLTGLRNRHAFEGLLRRQLLRSSMNRKPLAVLMVDIDDFRRFNRDFGHGAGDHAVYAVAQTLQDQVRPTDIVARMDGDKFAIVLPDSDENGARVVAARLREAVAEAVVVMADESILPSVTVSIGISEMQPFQKAEELTEAADQALTRAKDSGRNTHSN